MRVPGLRLAAALLFTFLISTTAIAQLSLDSTLPADGATNVSMTIDLQLVFSAALDTTYRPGSEDQDFYLAIELLPEDTTRDEIDVEINADLDTVTALGVQLEPDTRYILFLTGAKSLTGELLDRPYVTTFTTGATLPTGAVSGEVTFPGGDPSGTALALFAPGKVDDDFVAVGVANSPFTISFVPDGVYTLMAIKDVNEDGELELEGGDAFGVYDGNGDGLIDTLVVANADTLTGIDLEIEIPVPHTSRHHLPDVEIIAQDWASDATLTVVDAGEVDAGGEAVAWNYIFSSEAQAAYHGWVAISGTIFPIDLDAFQFPDSSSLPIDWIDSDSAATVAEANGGTDFRADFPDVETWAGLHPFFGPPSNLSANSSIFKWLPDHDFPQRFGARAAQNAAGSAEEPAAIWFFGYYSHEHDKFWDVAVDALTGDLLFSSTPNSARERLPAAEDAAAEWSADAELIEVGSYDIGPDGLAPDWKFIFYSASKDSVLKVHSYHDGAHRDVRPSHDMPSHEPLPPDWIDSPDAAAVAEANSDNFRDRHPDEHWVNAELSRFYPGGQAIWRFEFGVDHDSDQLTVGIDAVTGDLLFSSTPGSAREQLPAAEDAATEWSADAELTEVETGDIWPDGLARDWEFIFYSATKDSILKVHIYHEGAHREVWPGHDMPSHVPLPPDWIDSPDAATVAEANSDNFRDRHPDEHWVNAHLAQFYPGGRAIWRFEYGSHDGSEHLTVGIDALTGELAFSSTPNTARERLPFAEDIANGWAADAMLLELGTPEIAPDGLAKEWEFGFYSATKDSSLRVHTYPDGGHHEIWPGHHMPSDQPLPPDWIDSPVAADIAEENSDDFRGRHPDQHWVNAHLSRGHFDGDRAIWWFDFGSHDGMDHLRIGLDAVTGEVVHQEGPLRFVGSAPAHGDTSVPTLTTFSLEFTAPLDTFAHSLYDIVDLEFFPPDSVGEPDSIEFSPDLKTVTAQGLPLTANTRFTALLTNARGQHGQYLPRPHVITFTTGEALPPGAVSGEVVLPEGEGGGAMVTLFGKDIFYDKVGGIGVSESPYVIDFVEDGTYLPVGFRFHSGPEFGFFDPDGDGSPDTVVVAGGDSISGIDIEFQSPPLHLAREKVVMLQAAAHIWAADAVLVSLASEGVNPDGTAPNWVYVFYSATLDDFNAFFLLGEFILPAEFDGGPPDPLPLPVGWIDSDDAIETAENNGGAEFRAQHEFYHVVGFLSNHEEEGDTLNTPAVEKNGMPLLVGKRWRSYSEFLKLQAANAEVAVWFFSYFGDAGEWLDVAVDALTGELLFVSRPESARERLPLAAATVAGWAADAALINLGTRQIGPEGRSQEWRFVFYSALKDSLVVIETFQGHGFDFFTMPLDEAPSLQPLPLEWKDSPDVIHIAEQASEHFRQNHHDIWVDTILSHGLLEGHGALWFFRYMSFAADDTFRVAIDAVTGDLVTGVADDVAGVLPESFALEQNYPNPFNPETTIKYDLAADSFVELTVFNLLGQKVRALVSKSQSAGVYKQVWDGRDDAGQQMPSGLYIYRLKAADFTQTRKMIFLK